VNPSIDLTSLLDGGLSFDDLDDLFNKTATCSRRHPFEKSHSDPSKGKAQATWNTSIENEAGTSKGRSQSFVCRGQFGESKGIVQSVGVGGH
jgi:hypothetical protein